MNQNLLNDIYNAILDILDTFQGSYFFKNEVCDHLGYKYPSDKADNIWYLIQDFPRFRIDDEDCLRYEKYLICA